ncbi:MAG TPA: hypothetical protein PK971_17065 [Saprospiraceae bacterium]|nr:hypothetical protein [Saprospiraceae bacterium]HND90048.1 hypothetical protein [Saprospiraceae bacterium]HNG90958.1 hypothetical protein [Saprospiraceae bacterium]
MKNTLVLLLLMFSLSQMAVAQQPSAPPATTPKGVPAIKTVPVDSMARTLTQQMAQKYTLSADQAKQMYQVQARKLRNLRQIEGLRASQPALYKSKLQSLQTNTLASVRQILNNKTQVELYKATQSELRMKRAKKREEMLRQHADRAAIDIAVLEIYAE